MKPLAQQIEKHLSPLYRANLLEAFFWMVALAYLAFAQVEGQGHFTLCPLALAGFNYCPGCGLGRAIALALQGHIGSSISMHPFGVPAILLIADRIGQIVRFNTKTL